MKNNFIKSFLLISSILLCACDNKNGFSQIQTDDTTFSDEMNFWSCFGTRWTNYLDVVINDEMTKANIELVHESKGSLPGIRKEMIYAIATNKYPELAMGAPSHFAQYHASNILRSLDNSFSSKMFDDFYSNYLVENYFYDQDGTKHLYSLPFCKYTELMGYNGAFVDYCAEKYGDSTLLSPPTTWAEWSIAKSDPASKAGRYYEAHKDLIRNKRIVWATQNADGSCCDFVESSTTVPGKIKVFDFANVEESNAKLMTWCSTDNAFITLLRQWGAQYTTLPESEYAVHPKRRHGHILFANEDNLSKTISMLRTFKKMYDDDIFGTPGDIGGSFASEAFSRGCVMFMINSSGQYCFNTSNWENRFRVAPIPYSDANRKFVMASGVNLCMTKQGDEINNFTALRKFCEPDFQAKFAVKSGVFPVTRSACETNIYQDFLQSNDYSDTEKVFNREAANVNYNNYVRDNWCTFVDDAFIGSDTVREQVAFILPNVLKNVYSVDSDAQYISILRSILNSNEITGNINLIVD